MKVRALLPLAAAAGIWFPAAAFAQQPAPLPAAVSANPNQTLADSVASRLRGTDLVAGADVSIIAEDGMVRLSGTMSDAARKERLIAVVRSVAGVIAVRDEIAVVATGIVRVQDPPLAAPIAPNGPAPILSPVIEPAPVGLPGQASPDLQAPPLPPYAWPTYAPHNNLSRVAYPEAYPYNAFPFIGPYYPFPKVPLGWRKVTLEWEDGHWFLGRASAPQDYWKVRFW